MTRRTSTSGNWTMSLGEILGIPIRLHLTFFILLAYVAFFDMNESGSVYSRLLFVVAVFSCVLLHELGHAITAKYFKIKTKEIVLYPFGGIANLMSSSKPKEEFFISIAGPLTNLVIAFLLLILLELSGHGVDFSLSLDSTSGILSRIYSVNIALAIFNLLPALPMDGGRIMRSLLQWIGVRNATAITARLSQVLCLVAGIFAIVSGNIILLLIAIIIFSGAIQELVYEKTVKAASGFKVKDVMVPYNSLEKFTHGTTKLIALNRALQSFQSVFPVVHGDEILGVISRDVILQHAALEAEDSYITQDIERDIPSTSPETSIEEALTLMTTNQVSALFVKEGEETIGVLLKDKLLEFLLITEVRKRSLDNARFLDETP